MTLGTRRMEAIKRLGIGGVFLFVFVAFIAPVLLIVALIAGAIDIVWQLLTDKPSLGIIGNVADAWDWLWGNVLWTLFGEGEFRLTPPLLR